ncbi:hypothetical protein [Methanocaldococcus vulcanius]|uniref:hypothetical protein n=1 Tax=Methanocaldococcus vulcanius TaxID=73913 RepID=UPI00064ED11B|nr:hypothetical protein [Methanocaldococcus vulcanius]
MKDTSLHRIIAIFIWLSGIFLIILYIHYNKINIFAIFNITTFYLALGFIVYTKKYVKMYAMFGKKLTYIILFLAYIGLLIANLCRFLS